ncbi:MAG TPA: flagellin [Opitutaceae bacterium]|nr:flagellin [Opitutaceae bacterium]
MSVVISTNSAASVAADNLAFSTARLQDSLNKLSSGSKIVAPSDDAGGLAVSMKLATTANRQSTLLNNIGNATSYAQTQDGALQVAGSILNRISELEALYQDPTKNSSDLANYDDEFGQLATELTALGAETFNGVHLFGTASLNADATDDLSAAGAVPVAQSGVFSAQSSTLLTDDFTNSSDPNFTTNGLATISGGTLDLQTNGAAATNLYLSGAFQLNFDITSSSSGSGPWGMSLQDLPGSCDFSMSFSNGATHSVQVNRDAAGNISFLLDGAPATDRNPDSLTGRTGSSRFLFYVQGAIGSPISISNLTIAGPSNLSALTAATSLASLSAATVTGAIQEVAAARATNGAEQSRLGFAASLLTTNQTNLQSAVSNITDVDVASQTAQLAKWNVLVQAGASMLTQANQLSQVALKLITG